MAHDLNAQSDRVKFTLPSYNFVRTSFHVDIFDQVIENFFSSSQTDEFDFRTLAPLK